MPEPRIYPPVERPLVEVLVDGRWCPGELRAWFPNDDETWRANVSYSTGPGENRLATVPAEQVRPAPEPGCSRAAPEADSGP